MKWTNVKALRKEFPLGTLVKLPNGYEGKITGYDKDPKTKEYSLIADFEEDMVVATDLFSPNDVAIVQSEQGEEETKTESRMDIYCCNCIHFNVPHDASLCKACYTGYMNRKAPMSGKPEYWEAPKNVFTSIEPSTEYEPPTIYEVAATPTFFAEEPTVEEQPIEEPPPSPRSLDDTPREKAEAKPVYEGVPEPSKASQIRALLAEGKKRSEIARILGVNYRYVYHIEHLPKRGQ